MAALRPMPDSPRFPDVSRTERPKNPIRRLCFDSPSPPRIETRRGLEQSPSTSDNRYPSSWEVDDVDLDARIMQLREELIAQNGTVVPLAAPDPRSGFRTEYRRILAATNIITEVMNLQNRQVEWMQKTVDMSAMDIESLENRKKLLEDSTKHLRFSLNKLNASISKNTQMAVKTIIEIREDDDVEDIMNSEDDYEKYTKISRLCESALKSYDDVILKTNALKLRTVLVKKRSKEKQKMRLSLRSTEDQKKLEISTKALSSLSVDKLRNIRAMLQNVPTP